MVKDNWKYHFQRTLTKVNSKQVSVHQAHSRCTYCRKTFRREFQITLMPEKCGVNNNVKYIFRFSRRYRSPWHIPNHYTICDKFWQAVICSIYTKYFSLILTLFLLMQAKKYFTKRHFQDHFHWAKLHRVNDSLVSIYWRFDWLK